MILINHYLVINRFDLHTIVSRFSFFTPPDINLCHYLYCFDFPLVDVIFFSNSCFSKDKKDVTMGQPGYLQAVPQAGEPLPCWRLPWSWCKRPVVCTTCYQKVLGVTVGFLLLLGSWEVPWQTHCPGIKFATPNGSCLPPAELLFWQIRFPLDMTGP